MAEREPKSAQIDCAKLNPENLVQDMLRRGLNEAYEQHMNNLLSDAPENKKEEGEAHALKMDTVERLFNDPKSVHKSDPTF